MTILETLTTAQQMKLIQSKPTGVFTTLFTNSDPWIEQAGECCAGYYLQHSAKKTVSPFYLNVYAVSPDTTAEVIGNIIRSKFIGKWANTYNALNAEYNALYNESVTVTETESGSEETKYGSEVTTTGTDTDTTTYNVNVTDDGTTSTKETTTRTNTAESNLYGFSSDTPVGDTTDTESVNETVQALPDDNTTHNTNVKTGTETKEYGKNDTQAKSGSDTTARSKTSSITREGFTNSPTDNIMKELELRKTNVFFNIIYDDIDSMMALQIYV